MKLTNRGILEKPLEKRGLSLTNKEGDKL